MMTSRHTQGSADGAAPPARVDASMTLINEFYRRPLDPGYALAAQRRQAGEAPSRTRSGIVALVVLALALGLGTAAATLQLRKPLGQANEARRVLESQITERGDEAADLQAQATALGDEISALQSSVLGDADASLRTALDASAVESGAVEVTGKGLRIELSDAPSSESDGDAADPDARVQDSDLQVLVNSLWESGAEAIAINGQRLAATTAIRSAGSAVLVDLVPLSSPYTVEAIGDSVTMQTDLARSSAGQLLATLRATYGIGVEMSSQRHVELPAVRVTTLREATVPEGAGLPELRVQPEDGSGGDGDPVSPSADAVAGSSRR